MSDGRPEDELSCMSMVILEVEGSRVGNPASRLFHFSMSNGLLPRFDSGDEVYNPFTNFDYV